MSKILDLFSENPQVTQAIAKSVPAIMGMYQANKAKGAMEKYQTALDNIEKNRQEIVNPYANVTNPFANMQVATKAAEMQAEQTDIALANTLDNLRQTGAGGATALAQAALKSKQGITANIQQQEMQNQRLAAQGEQRMQQLKGAGQARAIQMQEMRDARDMNRLQQNIDIAQQQRAAGISTAARAGASAIAGLSESIKPEVRDVENNITETNNTSNFVENDQYKPTLLPNPDIDSLEIDPMPLSSSTNNDIANKMRASGYSDAQINYLMEDPSSFSNFIETFNR